MAIFQIFWRENPPSLSGSFLGQSFAEASPKKPEVGEVLLNIGFGVLGFRRYTPQV